MATTSPTFSTRPDHGLLPLYVKMPLPGVVILVHGVNSDGEWYESAETGLCKGLNRRLARQDTQLARSGVEAGQLTKASYTPELTAEGFLQPKRNDKTFIVPTPNWSPVIRFRWGYKASQRELKDYGANVWLNENDYWGGGPFANGCSSVADLWGDGLNDRLFLWITAQHLNPVPGRDAYACPPRAYYVQAALRLAKLIASIRDKQADCPISVMCHSQGNMVGLGAAFLADALGVQADNYILNNPPLSLVPDDDSFTESWTQRTSHDPLGAIGRQNDHARTQTLKNFFELLRARAGLEQDAKRVDHAMANEAPQDGSKGYTAEQDRQAHGLNGHTYGRVTLYCNPHDQVISALTVQGIGWRGMSQDDIDKTGGAGVFTQRVFAQGYRVGQQSGHFYDYWNDRWNKDKGVGKDGFWYPPSPAARFSLRQGVASNTTVFGKLITVVTAPVLYLVKLAKMPVSAEPPKPSKGGWKIPIDAPMLPEPFLPEAYRFGKASVQFDEGYDPGGSNRNASKALTARDQSDPYDSHATQETADKRADLRTTDAPMGDEGSEAQLRYEDRARLRMKARRAQMTDEHGKVVGEDEPDQASPEYTQWRNRQIAEFLNEAVNQNATDHSTIVTNAMHIEKATAYDVAIGECLLTDQDWQKLRVEADWSFAAAMQRDPAQFKNALLGEYFLKGLMDGQDLHDWAKQGEAAMPPKVINERVWKPIETEWDMPMHRRHSAQRGGI